MRNLFNPSLNCEQDSLIISSAVILTDVPQGSFARILSTDSAGTLLLNGELVGQVAPIVSGDSLQIQAFTSVDASTPVYVGYEIAGETGFYTLCTRDLSAAKVVTGYGDLIPLSVVAVQASVSAAFGASVSCVIGVYDIASTDFIQDIPVVKSDLVGEPGIPFVDYYANQLYQLSTIDSSILGQTQVGAQPYGVCRAADLTWVTLSGQNNVVAVDVNNVVVRSIGVGSRPLGIASWLDVANNKWHILVANNGSSTLTHLVQQEDANWVVSTIVLAVRPFEIAIDSAGRAWVTSTAGTFWEVDLTTDTARTMGLGVTAPRAIVYNPTLDRIHVTCPLNNKVVTIVPSTRALTSVSTVSGPYSLAVNPEGVLFVGCFTAGVVQKVVGNVIVDTFSVDAYPLGLRADSTSLYVTNHYGLPQIVEDHMCLPFNFVSPEDVLQRTFTYTSQVRIRGLDGPTTAKIPHIYGASILKNDVNAGQQTTAVTGDVLGLSFTTPQIANLDIDIPLYVGTIGNNYITKTREEDATPDLTLFAFTDYVDAVNGSNVKSSLFTVAGIDPAVSLALEISQGTIFVNGVDTLDTLAYVKQGDVVQLESRAPSAKNESLLISVTLAGVTIAWKISTKVQPIYWIKSAYKGVGQLDTPFTPNMSSKLTKINNSGIFQGTYDLHAVPSGEDIRNSYYVFVPSYFEDCVYRVSVNGSVAERIEMPAGSNPFAICTAPKTSRAYNRRARQFVTLAGSNQVAELKSANPPIDLPGSPRAIVTQEDGTNIYVSIPELGQIVILQSVTPSDPYYVSKIVDVGGHPYDMVMWGKKLLFSDPDLPYLQTLENGVLTSARHNCGLGVWDMEPADSNVLWTANSYDNTVSRILLDVGNTVTLASNSVPNGLAWNTTTRQMTVSHYGQLSLMVFSFPYTLAGSFIDLPVNVTGLTYTGQGSFGASLYTNIAFGEGCQDILEFETPMSPLVWPNKLDVQRSSTVRSANAIVSGVVRTVRIFTKQVPNIRLVVNDVVVGWSAKVKNGDTVAVEIVAPDGFALDTLVKVSTINTDSTFFMQTEGIKVMNPVEFFPQTGIKIREVVTSNEVVVSGLTDNLLGPVSVFNSEWVEWTVIINGVLQSNVPTVLPNGLLAPHVSYVKNGDILALHGICRGQYNSVTDYVLLSADVPVGTLKLSNKLLDGPETDLHNVYMAKRVVDNPAQPWERRLSNGTQIVVELVRTAVKDQRTLSLSEPRATPVRAAARQPIVIENVLSFTRGSANTHATFEPPLPSRVTATFKEGEDNRLYSRNVRSEARTTPAVNFINFIRPDLYEVGPAKEYTRIYVGVGARSAEPKWEKQNFSAGKLVAKAVFDKHGSLGLKTLRARYLANRATTPKLYSVQYTRNVTYDQHYLMDVFDSNAVHTQRTAGTTFERNAIHPQYTTVAPFTQFGNPPPRREAITGWSKAVPEKVVAPDAASYEIRRSGTPRLSQSAVFIKQSSGAFRILSPTATQVPNGAFKLVTPAFTKIAQAKPKEVESIPFVVLRRALHTVPALTAYVDPFRDPAYQFSTTSEEQGLFASPQAALEYAESLGYPDALTVQVGQFYTWNTPAIRQQAECSIVQVKLATPNKWYVHGG